MNHYIPVVRDCMSTSPYSVASHETLTRARTLMRKYRIRHLPVMESGKLVGVLSDRDLSLVLATRPDLAVEYAMAPKPYAVTSDMPLNKVARDMAERKCGSAVVMDHGAVVGVFTTTDALSALADALENKHVRPAYERATVRPARRRTRPLAREAG